MPYKNFEQRKQYQKNYRESHREESKNYKKEHLTESKEYGKKSYLKHRRERMLKVTKFYQKNKERINLERRSKKREYQKQYLENPENQLKAKARIIAKIISIQGFCEICHKNLATDRHHSDYNFPWKIQLICHSCHQQIHGYGLIEVKNYGF